MDVDKNRMDEARKKPKILLLREANSPALAADAIEAWARLAKALNTFTELENREISSLPEGDLAAQISGFDLTFLDSSLAPWPDLSFQPAALPLCLVQPAAFSWSEPLLRAERLEALARHPLLILEGLTPADLVRVLHFFLTPKRLAGAAPLMEKGSLILAEKVMEPNAVGGLLDRVGTFLDRLDGFSLNARVPDLRQVVSALLSEGLSLSREKAIHYPYVDFQISPAGSKVAVNLRFPRGKTPLEAVVRDTLSGGNLFWHQIWQCSDALMLTHHKIQDELEVMALLCRPERNLAGQFRTLLFKTAESSAAREDLLTPPGNYRFVLISEITAKESGDVEVFSGEAPDEDESLADLPEHAVQKIRHLAEQARVLTDHVSRKDIQIQDLTKRIQQLTQETIARRSEALKAIQSREVQSEAAERQIQELQTMIGALQSADGPKATAKDPHSATALQEIVARLEGNLRATENEKGQLKESVAQEGKRLAALEAKYSQVYKDLSTKDREVQDLKAALGKLRREADKGARGASEDKKDANVLRLKELEEHEATLKQDVKRLVYKVETMEKTQKAQQSESAEKQKLYELKLKQAKTREVELLHRIEELTATLKKLANKAA